MSVRPSIFLYAKNTQNLGKTGPPVPVFISMASERSAIVTSGAGRHSWLAQTHRIAIRQWVCVCVGGGVHVLVHAYACMRASVRA